MSSKAEFWRNAVFAALGIAAFAALAGFFGYKWLARDEVNRSYACSIGSWDGVCFAGEAMNMVLSFVFTGIAVFGIVFTVRAVRARRAADTAEPENNSGGE
ncbi:MAG: hypothetical protein QOD58_2710 [Mycobacterium sp.]|nr:hypothetical protein [Mycobacterium sp.]MDT5174344.1 hypothetical protein [Mycobacterium sp.]